jgi:multiple sugar transport system substrate-binding protein
MPDHAGSLGEDHHAERLTRRRFIGRGSALGVAALGGGSLFAACGGGGDQAATGGGSVQLTFASAKFFGSSTISDIVDSYNKSQSRIRVKYIELPPPSSSTEVHQQLVQQLGGGSGTPDVFTQDVIWIAEFAGAGWAMDLSRAFGTSDREEYFPGLIDACTYDGKLTALPWFVDSGMLYYRKDLLKQANLSVPETWDDLVSAATKLTQSGTPLGFVWQGKQAEVLVCDLVSFIGSFGGAMLAADGKTVQIADPPAQAAVQFMYDTINRYKITPKDVLGWDEEPSRRPFTAGQAAFLRNWSYVFKIAEDPKASKIVGKAGIAPLPHDPNGKSSAALGGYQYGVNAKTKHPEEAIAFVRWMSSADTQLRFATELGLAPSRPAVFDSRKLKLDSPDMVQLKDVFVGATPRPVTPKYPQVTLAIQSSVSRALSSGDVKGSLEQAKTEIERIVGA